jgi:hypothetical protein
MKALCSALAAAILMAFSAGTCAQTAGGTAASGAAPGKSKLEKQLSRGEGDPSPSEEAYFETYLAAAQACKTMARPEKQACLKDARAKAAKAARMTK